MRIFRLILKVEGGITYEIRQTTDNDFSWKIHAEVADCTKSTFKVWINCSSFQYFEFLIDNESFHIVFLDLLLLDLLLLPK